VRPPSLAALAALATVAALACAGSAAAGRTTAISPARSGDSAAGPAVGTRAWRIRYRAHNGRSRTAYVLLPAWYGPRDNPHLPLIISPHGRGLTGRQNTALWGNLPAHGSFAVVSPDGHGRRLPNHSWGFAGQIDDLARMPRIVQKALPWLRIDGQQIYAFGGSMGGQESLLLLARYPRLLAGVAAFDSVTDLALQYTHFPRLACRAGPACRELAEPLGTSLQKRARREIGGTPKTARGAFAARSPMRYVREIAFSCVPLQLWWSVADRVIDQQRQSGKLFWEIRRLNPDAPAHAFAGFWIHTAEMHHRAHLQLALSTFELMGPPMKPRLERPREVRPRPTSTNCVPRRGR
jgi:pimeloyl-ACP methyl ester carboxylesterase